MRRYPLFMLILLVIVAGCRSADDPELPDVPAIQLTPTRPVEYGTLISGCRVEDLESWYENASQNLQTYRTEIPNALIQPADINILSRLTEITDAIIAVPVPECVQDLQNLAMSLVVAINEQYLAYYESRLDQATLQNNANLLIQRYDEEVQPILDSTRNQLDTRLQGE